MTPQQTWYIAFFILVLALIFIITIKTFDQQMPYEYKYIAGAIGLAGFSVAILGDGIFVTP